MYLALLLTELCFESPPSLKIYLLKFKGIKISLMARDLLEKEKVETVSSVSLSFKILLKKLFLYYQYYILNKVLKKLGYIAGSF